MSEEQIKNMILKQCLELTTNNDFRPPISAYDGVDIDDVVRTCKQLQDKKTYLDLVKENQELKKQVEEYENIACNWKDSCLENAGKIEKLENQQKEFISYLENEIKSSLALDTINKQTAMHIYSTALRKYKSIIGGKE